MRISDWSSDVCSSDLLRRLPAFMLAVIRVIRKTLAAAGLVALILALASPASAGGQQAASGGAPSAPEGPFGRHFTFSDPPGPAPSVPFQTLDGPATAFADSRGQVLLVHFWENGKEAGRER